MTIEIIQLILTLAFGALCAHRGYTHGRLGLRQHGVAKWMEGYTRGRLTGRNEATQPKDKLGRWTKKPALTPLSVIPLITPKPLKK
jgi:hypothetical protein